MSHGRKLLRGAWTLGPFGLQGFLDTHEPQGIQPQEEPRDGNSFATESKLAGSASCGEEETVPYHSHLAQFSWRYQCYGHVSDHKCWKLN